MSDVPVAAPAAAPVATPSATPVSTPAASTSTPVSTPPVATSDTTTSAATSIEVTQTPAADTTTAAATEKPGRPERATYGDDIEKFLKDTYAWEEQNPDGTDLVTGDEVKVTDDLPVAEKTPEEIAAEEAAKLEVKTEDKPLEVEAPTPEGLAKLFENNPEFKAAMEASPEVKGALFAMARQNAKAAPILEVFPNVESAKFANENANQFVGLKTAFLLSDSPEKMKDAAGMFLEQFSITDDKGQPVLDAQGNPTYGEDLPLFVSEIKSRDNGVRMASLKERIEANSYATAEGKQNDEDLLAAYEFIQAAEAAGPDELDKPDTSKMDPASKAYFDKKEGELKAERERLGLKEKEMSGKQVAETRARFDTQYREKFGGNTGTFISKYLEQKEKDGVAIPRYLLTMKDPKTDVSILALTAFQRLNAKLDSLPDVKSHSATLQMNAINDAGLQARVKFGQDKIAEHLPDIIDAILKEAGVSMAEDAKQKIADREAKRGDARVEPAAGGPVSPKGMSAEQLMAQARTNVEKKHAGQFVDPAEKMRQTLIERDRLETQR